MTLTVLNVASWLNAVDPGAVGGAEQIVSQIDAGLVRRGHRSLVIARPGSRISGTLIPTSPPDTLPHHGAISNATWWAAHGAWRRAISETIVRHPVDIVHMHGMHFANYLPPHDIPTLVTFHLPLSWYKSEALQVSRPNTFFQCVSRSQRELFPASIKFLPDIENGVPCELLQPASHIRRRDFVVMLG